MSAFLGEVISPLLWQFCKKDSEHVRYAGVGYFFHYTTAVCLIKCVAVGFYVTLFRYQFRLRSGVDYAED